MSDKQTQKLSPTELWVTKEKLLGIINDEATSTTSGRVLALPATQKQGTQPVHQELLDNLTLLVPHMLIMIEVPGNCEFSDDYIKDDEILKDETKKGFYVTGFSISDKGLLNIKGGIRAESGRVAPLNANNISIDVETSPYRFAKKLNQVIEALKSNATDYFIHGKFGAGAQTDAFIDVPNKDEKETQKV